MFVYLRESKDSWKLVAQEFFKGTQSHWLLQKVRPNKVAIVMDEYALSIYDAVNAVSGGTIDECLSHVFEHAPGPQPTIMNEFKSHLKGEWGCSMDMFYCFFVRVFLNVPP